MNGVCGKCRRPVQYVSTPMRGNWVHTETGRSIAGDGDDQHDANTHFIKNCDRCGGTGEIVVGPGNPLQGPERDVCPDCELKPDARQPCSNPEGHQWHMRANGECPWCSASDPWVIDPAFSICEAHGNPDCGLCEG